MKKDVLRGGQNAALGKAKQNFLLVSGTEPGRGVKGDTKLIRDVCCTFELLFDKRTLMVNFPEVLQHLEGTDTKIEIVTSSMLQPLRFGVRGNRVEDASAYIFVSTHLQRGDLPKIEYINA